MNEFEQTVVSKRLVLLENSDNSVKRQ